MAQVARGERDAAGNLPAAACTDVAADALLGPEPGKPVMVDALVAPKRGKGRPQKARVGAQ